MCFNSQTLSSTIFCRKKQKTAHLYFGNVPHHFNDCLEMLPCVCKSGCVDGWNEAAEDGNRKQKLYFRSSFN